MRILIADDSRLRINSLSEILERQADKKKVGTAKTGTDLFEQIENLNPDLVLLSLKDEIPITKVISLKYPRVKVLILTSLARSQFDRAIEAGAKGCLNSGVSEQDLMAAINAVMRGATVYFQQGKTDGEIPEQRFTFLEDWNNYLAAEIIGFWATNQQYTINLENSLETLGIKIESKKIFEEFSQDSQFKWKFEYIQLLNQKHKRINLLEELEKRKEYLFKELPPGLDSLNYIKKELEIWYKSNKSSEGYLKNKSLILSKELNERLETLIQFFWNKASLKESIEHLQKLEKILFQATSKYEEEKQECEDQARQCSEIYERNFSAIYQNTHFDKNYNIAQNALFNMYCAKVKAEIYASANRALEKLMQTNQSYLDDLSRANSFLTRIRQNLLAKIEKRERVDLFSPLILGQLSNSLSLDVLKKEVEQELSRSLCKWGVNRSISEEEVQELILRKISPLTQKISAQIKREARNLVDDLPSVCKTEAYKSNI